MTISRSVSYIIKPRTGTMAPRRIIMVQRETFLKVHLGSIRPIALLGEFRVRVNGLRYSLWWLRFYVRPCPRTNRFPGHLCIGWTIKQRLECNFDTLLSGKRPWSPWLESFSCCLYWCFILLLTGFWSAFHDLLTYSWPIYLFPSGVPYITSSPYHQWSCVPWLPWSCPTSSTGGPWCSMVIPWWMSLTPYIYYDDFL